MSRPLDPRTVFSCTGCRQPHIIISRVRTTPPLLPLCTRCPALAYARWASFSCVYPAIHIIHDHRSQERRVVRTGAICGAQAPRDPDQPLHPRYTSRFGDPLCKEHSFRWNDTDAFPPLFSTHGNTASADLLAANMKETRA